MGVGAVIGALRVDLGVNIAKFKTDMEKAGGVASRAGKGLEGSFKVIRGAAVLAAGGITALGAGVVALGLKGSKIAPVKEGFEALTTAVGESGAAMLATSRDATKGLISDLDLMQAANKGLLLGLPLTTESMGDMSAAAVVLGRAMGQEAGKSMDDLITALGRSSPLILDNLGLTVKVGEANQAYAAELGKTASQLTETEKKTAFYNAAMDAARAKVAELGGINLTFADRLQIVGVGFQNVIDQMGLAIARSPALNTALEAIGMAMLNAFGSNSQSAVSVITRLIDAAAIRIVEFGKAGVQAGIGLLEIYREVRLAFLGVVSAMAKGNALVLRALAIIGRFKGVASEATEALDALADKHDRAAESLDAQADVTRNYQDDLGGLTRDLLTTQANLQDLARDMRTAGEVTTDLGTTTQTTTAAANDLSTSLDNQTTSARKTKTEVALLTGVISDYQAALPTTSEAIQNLITSQRGLETAVLDSRGGFMDLDGALNQTVKPTVEGFSGILERFKTDGLAKLKGFATDGRGIFEGLFSNNAGGLGGLASSGLGLLQGVLTAALGPAGPLVAIFSRFAGQIAGFFGRVFSGIASGFRNLVGSLPGFGGPKPRPTDRTNPFPGVPGQDPGDESAFVDIPGLQSGGIVTRPTIVQAHSNEAVIPLNASTLDRTGLSMSGVEDRLGRIEMAFDRMPEMLAIALRTAVRQST